MRIFESDEATSFIIHRVKNPSEARSFLKSGKPFEQWRTETRAWVQENLRFSPKPVPPNVQILEEKEFDGYTRRHIVFHSSEMNRVTAYLLIPHHAKNAPAVMAMHDHSGKFYWGKEKIVENFPPLPVAGHLQNWRYGGRAYASDLARRGYVVMCPDTFGFGDRKFLRESWLRAGEEERYGLEEGSEAYINAYDSAYAAGNQIRIMDMLNHAGWTYPGLSVWDDRRALDVLLAQPEVDTARVGCVGLSMGGFRAIMLGSMDERITCSVPVGFMARHRDLLPYRTSGFGFCLSGVFDELPWPDFASLMAPRHMFIQNCANDALYDLSSMQLASEHIERVYDKAGVNGNYCHKFYTVGHQFDANMQDDAFAWMDGILKP